MKPTSRERRSAGTSMRLVLFVFVVLVPAQSLRAAEQVFAMAAWDGGAFTEVSVHNPSIVPTRVDVSFYLQTGGLLESRTLDIEPGATGILRKGSSDGSVQPGWIRLSSTNTFLARELLDITLDGRKLPPIGVLPLTPSRRITLFGYRSKGLETGLAISNPTGAPVTIRVKAREATGVVAFMLEVTLLANESRSLYVSQLFSSLAASFQGVIEIESQSPVGALTLLQDSNANVTTVGALAWEEGKATIGSCESIQAAIDTLPQEGGKVLIPAGRYPCKTAVVINRDNVSLVGEGAATSLELDPGANSPILVLGDTNTPPAVTHRGIKVSNLTLVGRWQQQTHECWGGPCDTGGLTAIRNNGITLRAVEDTTVENVSVRGCRSGGIVAEKGSRRITLRDIDAAENQWDGIAAYETTASVFTGLFAHDNQAAGLSLDLDFEANTISDATITDNGKVGIFMRDSRNNLFQGLQISACGEHGVFLAETAGEPGSAASGNTFLGLQVHNCQGAGVRVNDANCTNNVLVGGQFSENKGGCVSEASAGLVQQSAVLCR